MSRWHRYWFAPGGRHSAAAVRVAIALSVAWTLWRLSHGGYAADPGSSPAGLYRPVGILMLLGASPPSSVLLSVATSLGWLATVAMLAGVRTRTATVISWICVATLASFQVSFTSTWSHHNNLPLLAQLAFFGARGGDVWGVDAWLRRRRGRPPIDVDGGYQWSLRLVQLSVGLMFFSAAVAKWYFGHFTLAWALSDNLRHQLLARYDWIGAPRSAVAAWIIDDVWRYRGAACLNLVAQTMPLLAAALVHRPRLRALAGSVFVIEVLALGVVMNLWNVHWLPLIAVFVDWDRLRGWMQRRLGRAAGPVADVREPAAAAIAGPRRRGVQLFVAAFLLYDVVVAFGLDQRLRTYPFSAYPMFGYVRAKPPYLRHQAYEMPGTAIEILAEQPVHPYAQGWIEQHHTFRMIYKVRSVERLRVQLEALVATLQHQFPELGVHGVRLHFAAFHTPAYPAPAKLTTHRLGELGELRDGDLRSGLGAVRRVGDELVISPRWTGLDAPAAASYLAIVDYGLTPVALQVVRDGDTLRARCPAGSSILVVAVVGDARYVVGETGMRRW